MYVSSHAYKPLTAVPALDTEVSALLQRYVLPDRTPRSDYSPRNTTNALPRLDLSTVQQHKDIPDSNRSVSARSLHVPYDLRLNAGTCLMLCCLMVAAERIRSRSPTPVPFSLSTPRSQLFVTSPEHSATTSPRLTPSFTSHRSNVCMNSSYQMCLCNVCRYTCMSVVIKVTTYKCMPIMNKMSHNVLHRCPPPNCTDEMN